MKQKSPEVDIPEGVFYSDIDGYNIYVKHKDRKTGLLKDILIYNFQMVLKMLISFGQQKENWS